MELPYDALISISRSILICDPRGPDHIVHIDSGYIPAPGNGHLFATKWLHVKHYRLKPTKPFSTCVSLSSVCPPNLEMTPLGSGQVVLICTNACLSTIHFSVFQTNEAHNDDGKATTTRSAKSFMGFTYTTMEALNSQENTT